MQISREQLVFTFAVGGSGQSEHFAGDPREYKKLIPSVSIQEVEKKIKAAVYLTKAKQGKSDNSHLSMEKMRKSELLSSQNSHDLF